MPYIQKGKCVYLKKTGKKVGCSSSPEEAKRYLKALYANVHESFDSFIESILESTALGLLGFTNEEGTAYSYVYDPRMTHTWMVNRRANILGDRSAVPNEFSDSFDNPDRLQWRYVFANRTLYIWQEISPKSGMAKAQLQDFFSKKKWVVSSTKFLDVQDTPESNKNFNDSHFMS